ncbi:MAG TPA: ATP-binding cassette domain-containing protein [Thermodesulfovibrionales bacterium]|nr:ATP-binding cassette domain-containing protein [Thermodesulfovibrionales bacterium]
MELSVKLFKQVNGFNLDVEWQISNELAVLFGCSGAGKSMTLQLIAGLMKPDKGFVRLDGRSFFDSASNIDLSSQERSFGYVFQDLALFPHMTALNNILYGATGLGKTEKREKAREMIEGFHLEGLENKYPSEISGGQKQRIAFARALIRRPDVLLLDEPFSALDNPLRIEMRRFLRDIKDRFDVPIVLVTHDVAEAYTVADTLIVYSKGKVAQIGTPKDVFDNPQGSEVEILVNAR